VRANIITDGQGSCRAARVRVGLKSFEERTIRFDLAGVAIFSKTQRLMAHHDGGPFHFITA